jgi:hypothetical protein
MRVEFEPSLVARLVSNSKYGLASLRATKDRRIAFPAFRKASQVVGIGNRAGLAPDRFKKSRTAHECRPTTERHLRWLSACQSSIRGCQYPARRKAKHFVAVALNANQQRSLLASLADSDRDP